MPEKLLNSATTRHRCWWGFLGVFLLVVTWSLTNPMFAAPDENLHLARSQSTWLGDFSAPYSTDGVPVRAVGCFAFQSAVPADCMDTTWGPKTEAQLLPTTDGYPPFFYVVAGIPTRLVDDLGGAYAVRVWLAALCSLIVAEALRKLSALRTDGLAVVALIVSLTPMSVFLMSSVNPSGLAIALGALAVASGLTWRQARRPAELGIFAGCLVGIVLLRREGVVLSGMLAVSIVGPSAWAGLLSIRQNRSAVLGVVSGVTLAALSFVAFSWDFLAGQLSSEFTWSNWRMSLVSSSFYLHQLVGVFGWLDTLVSSATLIVWFVCVGLLTGTVVWMREQRANEAVFLLVACALLPLMFGFFRVEYFQTRYVLPAFVAGFVLYAVLHVPEIGHLRRWTKARRVLIAGVFFTHLTALLTNLHRYSHGTAAEVAIFTEPAWEPPGIGYPLAMLLGALATAIFASLMTALALGLEARDVSRRGPNRRAAATNTIQL